MYEILDHEADVGVKGYGKNWEQAFQEAAKAMFSLMTDLDKIKPRKTLEIEAESDEIDTLFIEFLNELLYLQSIHEMIFSEFKIKIKNNKLKGKIKGQKIKEDTELRTEVKAATYAGLKAKQENNQKIVQCILDV